MGYNEEDLKLGGEDSEDGFGRWWMRQANMHKTQCAKFSKNK